MTREINTATEAWRNVIRTKISELKLISDWAAMTNFGKVRDLCQNAQYELKKEVERLEEELKVLLDSGK